MINSLGCLCLRMPSLSFCVQSEFWLEWKVWPLGCVSVSACSLVDVTHFLYSCFESRWTLHITVAPQFCVHSHKALRTLYVNGVAKNGRKTYCTELLCFKNFKRWQQRIKLNVRPYECEPYKTAQAMPIKLAHILCLRNFIGLSQFLHIVHIIIVFLYNFIAMICTHRLVHLN